MKKIMFSIYALTLIMLFPYINYGAENSTAGCSLDMDYVTRSYDPFISNKDIESRITAHPDQIVNVAVVAQGVKNLDTYQIEITYNSYNLQFVAGYEDFSMLGIDNLLKKNGGRTIGFQAVKESEGSINITNTLTGKNTDEAPEGSGIIAIIKFKVLNYNKTELRIANVHFLDSSQHTDIIVNKNDGIIN